METQKLAQARCQEEWEALKQAEAHRMAEWEARRKARARRQQELEAQSKVEAQRQFLSQTLLARAVKDASYDTQGKLPCDVDTRVETLMDIRQWIYDVSADSQSILWLTGDPGCGKSAITASVARECKDANILWAQFFINRNDPHTTNPKSFFPSIALQLADHYPDSDVALAIHDALKNGLCFWIVYFCDRFS